MLEFVAAEVQMEGLEVRGLQEDVALEQRALQALLEVEGKALLKTEMKVRKGIGKWTQWKKQEQM